METQHPTKLDRLMHAIAEHHRLRATVELELDGFRVRVESNSAAVVSALRAHFARHVTPLHTCDLSVVAIEAGAPELNLPFKPWLREPIGARREEYIDIDGGRVVRKPRSGLQFLLGPDLTLAVGACVDNVHQIIALVNARYAERLAQTGWLPCQAASVALGDRAIVVCGASAVGKTSLALRLVERGASLLSSDLCMLHESDGRVRVAGAPTAPRVNPGTLLASPRLRGLLTPERRGELETLPTSDLWGLDDKRDLDVDALFGPRPVQLTAALHALVWLAWRPGRLGRFELGRSTLGERSDLLSSIVKRSGPLCRGVGSLAPRDRARDMTAWAGRLHDVPVLELTGDVSFAGATDLCAELLEAAA